MNCIRTDNGFEYMSKEFDDFCTERGIKRHKTFPKNPQQNGVAERANRTIVERVRCMLFSSGMGKKFWGEAASTAVYLLNKCPSSSIGGDTPDFRWYGKHSSYADLKPFGCKVFAHVKQGKLDPRALMCVMLGYQKGVKGYRLWCIEPGQQKVLISRDVIFLEHDIHYLNNVAGSDGVRVISDADNDFEVEPGEERDQGRAQHTHEATDDVNETVNESSSSSVDGINQPHTEVEDLQNYKLARDRVRRVPKPSSKFSYYEMVFYALMAAEEVELEEPLTYTKAMQSKEKNKWVQAMNEEMESSVKNKTWTLVDKVEGRKLVTCK